MKPARYSHVFALILMLLSEIFMNSAIGQETAWANDPYVQEVLAIRQQGIDAILAGQGSSDSANYSSTFVANTPDNGVVLGAELRKMFDSGNVAYKSIVMDIEYAASHGPDMVVLMGTETVVPAGTMRNAGKVVKRRFTDVFRKENGEWRHDLRHADVISVE